MAHTDLTKENGVSFEAWLSKLAEAFVQAWDYTPENARAYTEGQPQAWRDFYDDGFSPAEVALEDMRACLE